MDHQPAAIPVTLWLGVGCLLLGAMLIGSPEVGEAVVASIVLAAICILIIYQDKTDRRFLRRLFVVALCLRWVLAFAIFYGEKQEFFGGDAITYDTCGQALCQSWQGLVDPRSPWLLRIASTSRSGWGMFYYVAGVYYLLGQNPLAIQLINSAFGAAACVAIYKITQMVYPHQRVARTSAILIAFSPSMILWSSQELKDAPIVLCLCLCTLYTLKLRDKFRIQSLLLLLGWLFCLYSLRHYTFYILFAAIVGTLLFASKRLTPVRVLRGGVLIIVIGLVLAYFGTGNAAQSFDLKWIQASRVSGAMMANTGFGADVDITDPQAAITFLPVGVVYVLFAPFPWAIRNLRQLITLPELIIWWVLTPLMLKGYWFAMRERLRESFALCLFTIGLTLAYALYQSNVGTAYRHRAQLYVFFSIFISIGLELRRNARLRKQSRFALAHPRLVSLVPASMPAAIDETLHKSLIRS